MAKRLECNRPCQVEGCNQTLYFNEIKEMWYCQVGHPQKRKYATKGPNEYPIVKLPKGWTNFKIVEIQPGTFTGQVSVNICTTRYSEKTLQKITKEYLENLLGYKIEKHKI